MGVFIDAADLPEGFDGSCQLFFLLVAYGFILFQASNMISDGSELLLLVPSVAGLVGSVVLPILGAVPDGAIVLFSGMGANAQEQLSVGVGALAGSTILLLTVPWCMSIIAGRVNLDTTTGLAVYTRPHGVPPKEWSKLMPPGNMKLTGTGVSGNDSLKAGAYLMLLTSISYLIIQGPAFFLEDLSIEEVAAKEKSWGIATLITCTISFCGYLAYQWWLCASGQDEVFEDVMEEVRRNMIMSGKISLMGCMKEEMRMGRKQGQGYNSIEGAPANEKSMLRLSRLLRPFFDKYDADKSGCLDVDELHSVFKDLNENLGSTSLRQKDLKTFFTHFESNDDGVIDFNEFVTGVAKLLTGEETIGQSDETEEATAGTIVDGEGEGEEEEEVPEDLTHLTPEQQQFRIKLRALWMMAAGTSLVLIFSDPMVEVLSQVGERTGVSAFYVSFVLAPLASNASEVIASYNYAMRKTSRTITISLSALQGAACMNNTFCLGVFMYLIVFQNLAWEFSAETAAILIVQIVVAFVSMRKTQSVLASLLTLALYPLSLLLVAVLEANGWD